MLSCISKTIRQKGKKPVLILSPEEAFVLSLKMTSHPPHIGYPGEYNIIRWKEGELLGQDLLGVNRRWLDQDRVVADLDALTWQNKDGEEYLLLETGRQFVDPRHYLMPIPFTQYQLNPNLLPNNPGW